MMPSHLQAGKHRTQHHYSNLNGLEQDPEQHPEQHLQHHPISNTKATNLIPNSTQKYTQSSTQSATPRLKQWHQQAPVLREVRTLLAAASWGKMVTRQSKRVIKSKPRRIKQRSFFKDVHWLSTWSCKSLPAKNTLAVYYTTCRC